MRVECGSALQGGGAPRAPGRRPVRLARQGGRREAGRLCPRSGVLFLPREGLSSKATPLCPQAFSMRIRSFFPSLPRPAPASSL